jgi:hypothetical protein
MRIVECGLIAELRMAQIRNPQSATHNRSAIRNPQSAMLTRQNPIRKPS